MSETLSNFNTIGRDFEIVGINLKGKAKTPVLSLESGAGEKLTVVWSDRGSLSMFKIGMEFRMKLTRGEQVTLPFVSVSKPESVEPSLPVEQVPESSATIPEGECPKGVFPNEYGHSEVCDEQCGHFQRVGSEELGMGQIVCDLDPKPKEDQVEENEEKDSEEDS